MSEYKDRGHLCMGCMNPLPEGRGECGICGYPANGKNEDLYLSVGTILSERYLVGKLLRQVGDAAIYIGFDKVLKTPIQIREFLPDTLIEREPDGKLRIISGCENTFADYYEKFRSHARSLARMRELTSIVAVYDIFEQNHTAYSVSEFVEGNTLETRLKQIGGRMRWDEARPLFMPLLASLISLHSTGVLHLGISPENLIIGSEGKLHLQDFCISEARRVSTDLRPRLISGFSAPEQYGFGQDVDSWSDVYGLAATIFRTVTGNPPPDGSRRANDSNDLFVPTEVAKELPDYIAAALFNALQANPENRTRTIELFRDHLSTAPALSRMREDENSATQIVETPEDEIDEPVKKNSRTKYALLIVLAVFVFLLLLAGTVILLIFPEIFGGGNVSENTSSSFAQETTWTTTTTRLVTQSADFATPDLIRKNYYDIQDSKLAGDMKIEIEYKQFSNRPKGEILDQTPNAETPAEKGATIKIVISDGAEEITVPNVTGWNKDQAKLYLEALGFRVEIMPVVSATFDKDIVESVEEEGDRLKEGSQVTLRVSETTLTTTTEATEPTSWFPW